MLLSKTISVYFLLLLVMLFTLAGWNVYGLFIQSDRPWRSEAATQPISNTLKYESSASNNAFQVTSAINYYPIFDKGESNLVAHAPVSSDMSSLPPLEVELAGIVAGDDLSSLVLINFESKLDTYGVGDSFEIDGEKIIISEISPQYVKVERGGEITTLQLQVRDTVYGINLK